MNPAGFEPSPLDPSDWEDYRRQAHALLDACIDHLATARDHPWQPVSDDDRAALSLGVATEGVGTAEVADDLAHRLLPLATGNIHPRFFGWVHGTGLATGLLAEMAAATMNSNCGGRDHGAVYVEREVIDWCRRCFGFPERSSGVLVTGTSQATVIALAAARQRALGDASRRDGIVGGPPLAAYAVQGVHNATVKAMELLGVGAASLRLIDANTAGAIDVAALGEAIERDRAAGVVPMCVVATAGSVDLGAFDDLDAVAEVCAAHDVWLHVDGAFGAWARLADDPWRSLTNGIERADSLAFDFHKWMYVQYDCGAVLLRDEAAHRAAFAARPAYLASQSDGLGGGEPWYCDYGVDLSRGFRALKVWAALRSHGSDALGSAITRNCRQAQRMAARVEATAGLRLAAPVGLNVCCFDVAPAELTDTDRDSLNAAVAQDLQLAGDTVFSTTKVLGRTVLRAAIVNHRTCDADIDHAVDAAAAAAHRRLS
ncbi:MAG: pyridoxal phosphate-dependent decarboxylase family protein [Ilumatobacteraceae bacterium]